MYKIKNLNSKYQFYRVSGLRLRISTKSLKALKNYNIQKKINKLINNDFDGIKYKLQQILINRRNYASYSMEYNLLMKKTKKEYDDNKYSIFKLYSKLLFYRLKKLKPQLDFRLNILLFYRSPAGRNYYEENFSYDYDDLVKITSVNLGTENEKINIGKTQEKNREFVECINCDKLIDMNSIYCNFCGKKQIEENNDISFINTNSNENNTINKIFTLENIPPFDDYFLFKKKSDTEGMISINNTSSSNINSETEGTVKSNNLSQIDNINKENSNITFNILKETFKKNGIEYVNEKYFINDRYLTINYKIKLIDRTKLSSNFVSIFVSVHEKDDIINYMNEIEYLEISDFEKNCYDNFVNIPIDELCMDESLKILVYAKKEI